METAVMTGAWTKFSTEISSEEMAIFNKAMQGLVGVDYSPIAVSTQVVAGTNYKFFCNAQPVYPSAPTEAAMVEIYSPIQGEPHITSIKRC